MPPYDSEPAHRRSCLYSSRPDDFDSLDTWQGWMDTSLDITRALKVSVQGLEASSWTSSSYLATHPGCRSPASQPWPQLSIEIRSGSRTLEAPCGNRYAAARGMRVMMIVISPIQCSRLTLENCLRLKVRN